ncbi:hypothetical protein, partial [Rudaea sp.]|uniref:hypothetical protein n=1 Tax=Rudaea sp. TaxID=2136325 RepID=UPI0032201937
GTNTESGAVHRDPENTRKARSHAGFLFSAIRSRRPSEFCTRPIEQIVVNAGGIREMNRKNKGTRGRNWDTAQM